ncbi:MULTISPECIES: ABC transporter substrate-binding protein [unclassified Bradyrhizobium]|uniref:ABC transporter substrate-binding protein n=1 Tax=unclassified Bradyrhizobium TaxID=2631580 RepID=UPI001FF9A87E|nr:MULTISPECIES: ABC transporter substrate-binding protein [unclassified Bradyrhizobium]MCK1713179.1 ABC transporter substrate-binding protein [Bradyrhizobium sp. 143]MCK1727335.1 ABC transporter substrate-binding protein [Bradyrhizobium sp. 142]
MSFRQIERRAFMAVLGSAAACCFAARTQALNKPPVIAFMSLVTPERNVRLMDAFIQGLRDLDFVQHRDFELALRSAEGRLDRATSLAQEVIDLRPDVILATATPAVVSLSGLTKTIPIVCPLLADPVRLGLIASMSHPGSNVTGVLFRTEGLVGKQLELALQLIPGARRIGFLVNVAGAVVIDREELERTNRNLGVELETMEVRVPDDINGAFQALASSGVQAVVVQTDPMFFNERERISALAAAIRLPAVYAFRDHVDAGGLVSYGVNLAECFRSAAGYVVRILKGSRPSDLPVEFPTKLELIINLKAAKALGIMVPPILLATADEAIE